MSGSNLSRVTKRPRSRLAIVAAAAIAVSSAVVTQATPASAAPGDTVQILSFNDYHGHVEAGTPGSIDGSFGGPAAGGGEFLSAKLTELRDGSTATESFTVAAGDLIGGSPFFSGLFHDEPSVETLNQMELDISGVGNHEFDEGIDELLRMQNGGCHPVDGCYFPGDPYPGADFNWLAANVTEDGVIDAGTGRPETPLPEYEIRSVNGTNIAFIGMTLEGTDELVAAAGIAGYTFQDEVDTANALIPDIKAAGAEAIIVLLHEGGIPNPFAINGCAGVSGPIIAINDGLDAEIDAIVSGHTHQPYTCSLEDPDGNERPVTSAFSFGRVVTEINFELDAEGDVDRSTVTAFNHSVLQDELTADPAITAILDKWAPLAESLGNDPIGSITETITRGGDPTGSDRGVESAAGNLVADAQLAATEGLGAQIAFMNPGGVRSDLEFPESDAGEGDGVVTFGEAFTFQPFNNTMFVLPMTGEQIHGVLEEQCQPGDSSRPVLHLGVSEGFSYDLDITLQGGVCTGVEVSDIELDGTPIDMAATYLVAVNNFLADGGDNFDTFAEVDPFDRLPGPQDIDALTEYLDANSPVSAPPTDRVNEIGMTLPTPINSLTPARLLETRIGPNNKTVDGLFEGEGRVAAGGTVELVVAGRGGVADDASAAVLNLGAILPSADGFLTVYPCGEDQPLASNVNYSVGDVVSNSVLAKIGEDGKVCIYTLAEVDLIADVNSEVTASGSPTPVSPARVLETRDVPGFDTVDGLYEGNGRIPAGGTVELVVAGRDGVPSDAKAVIMNLGAILPDGPGFLTVFPCGTPQPLASNVNYSGGDVVSNTLTAKVGIAGMVCIYTKTATDLIADVNGYVPVDGTPDPLVPARLLETRTGELTVDGQFQAQGRAAAGSTTELLVTGRGGVPDDASTVVLNVASILPAGPGYLTIHPCGEDRPLASSVNYNGGDVISNGVIAKVGDGGKVCIYTLVETDLIADVTGTASPPIPFRGG